MLGYFIAMEAGYKDTCLLWKPNVTRVLGCNGNHVLGCLVAMEARCMVTWLLWLLTLPAVFSSMLVDPPPP